MTKQCTKCLEEKPLEAFYRDSNGRLGRSARCKVCKDAARAIYRPRASVKHRTYVRRHIPENMKRDCIYQSAYREKHRGLHLIRSARLRAEKKGLPFDLDAHVAEIEARIQNGKCELTGLPFNLKGGRTFDSPSLDHIDPQKGYVYSNLRIIYHALNSALGDWGEEKLYAVVIAWLGERDRKRDARSHREKPQRRLRAANVSII